MARNILSSLLLLVLVGCSTKPTFTRTVEVKVPVIVQAAPPEALKACGELKPNFRFRPLPGTNHAIIEEKDQQAFMDWVGEKQRCIEAWRSWARE